VEIGNNVKVGQSSAVYSFMFEPDKLLVGNVLLEDKVIIGPRSTVLPGCIIHTNTILSAVSFTMPFQELEANAIYFGTPAEYIRKIEENEY
jgi:carbonic anhydrase/acetyltransferase-like protein (isoleucine patch superfamily)